MIEVTADERGELAPISQAEICRRLAENDGTATQRSDLTRISPAEIRRRQKKEEQAALEAKRNRLERENGWSRWYIEAQEREAIDAERRRRATAIGTPLAAAAAFGFLLWAMPPAPAFLIMAAAAVLWLAWRLVVGLGAMGVFVWAVCLALAAATFAVLHAVLGVFGVVLAAVILVSGLIAAARPA